MMVDEFTYPEHVQAALDLVDAATAEYRSKEIEQRRRAYYREDRVHVASGNRKAEVIESKNAERRRKQIEAQQAKQARRVTPPTS